MALLKSPPFPVYFYILIFCTVVSLATLFLSSQVSCYSLPKVHDPKTHDDFGFTSILIHRDNPQSPMHNPNLTSSERIEAAVERSLSRMIKFPGDNNITFDAYHVHGEYIMTYYIGTPPFKVSGILDTGSELTWVQCAPCRSSPRNCVPRSNQFDPTKSRTFSIQNCSGHGCAQSTKSYCNRTNDKCGYKVSYADRTYSKGDIASETLTFGDPNRGGQIGVTNTSIGCGHEYRFPISGSQGGIIGLNLGPLSLLTQLNIEKFSYCLEDYKSKHGSEIRFASHAILSGESTPFYEYDSLPRQFSMHLNGLSVGSTRLKLPEGTFRTNETSKKGGFIIDSGTPFTRLKFSAFEKLITAIDNSIDSIDSGIWVCYNPARVLYCYCGITTSEDLEVFPDLTFHFAGLNLTLSKASTWIEHGEGSFCLAIVPVNETDVSIFGNLQQRNMNVGYDLWNEYIYFQPLDNCSS